MALQPLVCLAIVVTGAVLGPPAAHAESSCKGKRSVVARGAQMVVFWAPPNTNGIRDLCAVYRDRRALVVSDNGAGADDHPIVMSGHMVFFVESYYERGTGDSYTRAYVHNVARRRTVRKWQFYTYNLHPTPVFHKVRVLSNATTGFSVSVDEPGTGAPRVEIHRAMRRSKDVLATGSDIDPSSLRFRDKRMFWVRAGRERSAAFR